MLFWLGVAPDNGRQFTEFSQNRNEGAYWVFRCYRELRAPMETAKSVSELAAVSEIAFRSERHSIAPRTINTTNFEPCVFGRTMVQNSFGL